MNNQKQTINEFNKLLEEAWTNALKISDIEPSYIISGKGYDWFYNPNEQKMIRIPRGVEIFPLLSASNSSEMVPCMYDADVVYIKWADVEEVGWN